MVETYRASFTATITVLDLADGDLRVTVTLLDPDSDESSSLGAYSLAPSGQISNSVPPGVYRLDFAEPATASAGLTCTIEVTTDDRYTFVAVPGAIAVRRATYTPAAVRDLFVASSSLCRK